jgi:preprotein translocase subunit SecE
MNWWTKAVEFVSEVRTEMRKVSFPSRDEVVGTTVVVLITSFVFAVFLFVSDRLIIWGYQSIVKVFG